LYHMNWYPFKSVCTI